MSNEHRKRRQGKNYGSKHRSWGDTLSNRTGKAIKRAVEKGERQLSDEEIREFMRANGTQIKR